MQSLSASGGQTPTYSIRSALSQLKHDAVYKSTHAQNDLFQQQVQCTDALRLFLLWGPEPFLFSSAKHLMTTYTKSNII